MEISALIYAHQWGSSFSISGLVEPKRSCWKSYKSPSFQTLHWGSNQKRKLQKYEVRNNVLLLFHEQQIMCNNLWSGLNDKHILQNALHSRRFFLWPSVESVWYTMHSYQFFKKGNRFDASRWPINSNLTAICPSICCVSVHWPFALQPQP